MDTDKYFNYLDHQDWKPIIVVKQPDKQKKQGNNNTYNFIKKIEKKEKENDLKHSKIENDLRIKIIKSRSAAKLTQKELAQKCNISIQIINEIETGKAIYNHNNINKIRRILRI